MAILEFRPIALERLGFWDRVGLISEMLSRLL